MSLSSNDWALIQDERDKIRKEIRLLQKEIEETNRLLKVIVSEIQKPKHHPQF